MHGNSEIYYQNALHRVRFYGNISQQYFLYVLMLLKRNGTLENVSKGMTIKHLVQESLYSIIFPIPPLAEQHRIVARVDELMAKIDELEKVENELNALHKAFPGDMKAALLQAAMQGKLTEQLPEDGNAEDLLKSIEAEKGKLIAEKKIKKQKALEPIADDEIPFEIPDYWKWTRVREISKTVSKGTTPKGGNNAYKKSGIGFLRAENVAGLDKLNLGNLNYIDEVTHKTFLSRSVLEEGDILVTIAGTLGRTALVRKSDLPLNCNQAVAFIRIIEPSLLDRKYIIYALSSPLLQKHTVNKKKVTAIPNLTLEIISELLIPIPPLAEQRRIVEKLDKLLPLCDSLEEKL